MENVEMNQLISAIGQMMDEKLEPIKQNISSINQRLTSVELTIENDVKKNVQLLAEGHTGLANGQEKIINRLDKLEEKTDEIQDTVSVLKIVTKSLQATNK